MQAYEWPKKMVDIMKDALAKANAEHKEFEQQLKKRRKEFGELIDSYAKEVEGYHTKAEIIKRDQIAHEVQGRGARRAGGGVHQHDHACLHNFRTMYMQLWCFVVPPLSHD